MSDHKQEIPHPQGEVQRKGLFDTIKGHPLIFDAALVIIIAVIAIGVWYIISTENQVYIENSQIMAPIIALSPTQPGLIEKFYVNVGDQVSQGQKLAVVGNETITALTSGIIISTMDEPGQFASPGTPVVQMVDPEQYRVVGTVEEDKGLQYIKPGQKVVFTVDAFPGKQYQGVVETVGQTSVQSDIVFSISDTRQEQNFDVNVLFDTKAYPELKNGMSAKMWVYR